MRDKPRVRYIRDRIQRSYEQRQCLYRIWADEGSREPFEKAERKERVYGYSDITDKKNYSEIEFGFILREIYDRYFDLLKEYKSIVNNYSPYLFEKVSCMTLKTLNKEKITSILDITFNEFKGTSFQKKK